MVFSNKYLTGKKLGLEIKGIIFYREKHGGKRRHSR
jgi:hypothetical protein